MRIRTIKPEFWMHEGLCGCPEMARLLAIALLNLADDHGYFMANPILIRGQLFPFLDDSKIIPRCLQDLSRVGWIQLGKDDAGRSIGRIVNFSKHQRVDKPKPSTIKDLWKFLDESTTNQGHVQDVSQEEGKGMEGNGNGKEPPLSAGADGVVYPPEIEALWKIFPATSRNRSSKQKLSTAWKKTKPRPNIDEVINSARLWAQCDQWTRDGGQYAPGAHIWIKDRKWESEPERTIQTKHQHFAGIQEEIPLV